MHYMISAMISYLELENNHDLKCNCNHLKKINLTNEEWITIKQLIPVLCLFANATEFLSSSNYSTISCIYHAILLIRSDLASSEDYIKMINFTDPSTVFDKDIGYKDANKDIDNNPSIPCCKIRINAPQNCYNIIL
ncbi:4790_t:CDS:1 [Cetraspora pellucida]|uniref:4790_t:CDS:1 n=1 Tax=Cetraspora pellucida TaxID=1433469 RepID=A0A9N9JIW7_9GLOM|nr:4790_t:CDS:1 [Cetraspora pellucida]